MRADPAVQFWQGVVAASVARYIARISETSEVTVDPSAERHRATV